MQATPQPQAAPLPHPYPTTSVNLGRPVIQLGTPQVNLGHPIVQLGQVSLDFGTPVVSLGQPIVHMGQPQIIMGAPQVLMPPIQVIVGQPTIRVATGSENVIVGEPAAAAAQCWTAQPPVPPADVPPAAGVVSKTNANQDPNTTLPLVMRTPIQVKEPRSSRYIPGYAGRNPACCFRNSAVTLCL